MVGGGWGGGGGGGGWGGGKPPSERSQAKVSESYQAKDPKPKMITCCEKSWLGSRRYIVC